MSLAWKIQADSRPELLAFDAFSVPRCRSKASRKRLESALALDFPRLKHDIRPSNPIIPNQSQNDFEKAV
jgi:hypothetical protein